MVERDLLRHKPFSDNGLPVTSVLAGYAQSNPDKPEYAPPSLENELLSGDKWGASRICQSKARSGYTIIDAKDSYKDAVAIKVVAEAVRADGAASRCGQPRAAVRAGAAGGQSSNRKGWVESRGKLLLYSWNPKIALMLSPPGNSYDAVIDNTAVTEPVRAWLQVQLADGTCSGLVRRIGESWDGQCSVVTLGRRRNTRRSSPRRRKACTGRRWRASGRSVP